MYDIPGHPEIAKVTITPACVTEHAQPLLERDATRHKASLSPQDNAS